MITATKGRRLEHEVRELFRQAGYSVIRGAGSKGEVLQWKADLVATKTSPHNTKEVWIAIMQCKVKRK